MSLSAPAAGSCTSLQRKRSTRPSVPQLMMPRNGSNSPNAVRLTHSTWPAWSDLRASERPASSPDQEIVFLELCALHLFAHPQRRQAPSGPLQGLVELRQLVLEIGALLSDLP